MLVPLFPQVEVAAEELRRKHIVVPDHQSVDAHNFDAVKKWQKVVELSKEATVIFNAIDVGDYFDAAVSSLALKRKVPLIQGGTFRTTMTVDFYAPSGKPCWACAADVPDKELMKRLRPELIDSYESLEFIPEDAKPGSKLCSGVLYSDLDPFSWSFKCVRSCWLCSDDGQRRAESHLRKVNPCRPRGHPLRPDA